MFAFILPLVCDLTTTLHYITEFDIWAW